MNTQMINIGSQAIRVSIKPGKKGVTPLLLCTGIGASLELLVPFVEALHSVMPDTEIITFDYPGTGCSSTPMLPYRFSGLSQTVSQMLDYLDYPLVDILGISWGGMFCQEFTHQYPERVRKLILCATCAGVLSIPPSLKVLALMASPRRYIDAEYASSIAADIYGGKFRHDSELAANHAKRVSESKSDVPHSQLGYTYQQMCLWGWSSLWYLNRIKQPTLILAGDDDPIIALCNMKVLHNLIPNSTMYVFENEGHLFLLTEPDAVPIINEFLN